MLVWGIGGGVATAALAIAKALGAHVVVTSSSDEKLARARELGADLATNHATGDVVAAVKEATGGGAHVVLDDVGEATWKRTLEAARTEARIVVCGATTGPNPPAALHRLWWKQLSILGSTMGTPEDFQGVFDLIVAGKALPVVDRVFPLAEAARPTSASRPASSSARSFFRSRPEPTSAPAVAGALEATSRLFAEPYGPVAAASVTVDVYVPANELPGMATWIVGVTSTFPRPVLAAALKNFAAAPVTARGSVMPEFVAAVQLEPA